MPKRDDIEHILVIGSGPIVIGQACEFDYSGTQACRVLRAEGFRVSLINSNPATIMTDPEFADATYVEPLSVDFVEKVIAAERPDALLPTLGGQTALNLAVELYEAGILAKYGVELIGADVEAIQRGEDRQRFKDIVRTVGGDVPASLLCRTLEEAMEFAAGVDNRVVIRPSYTMGGLGSGLANGVDEVRRMVSYGLAVSPVHEVLVEQSVLGWKEYELELMRDRHDNVVIVCSIENLDPMGVHTGDSITVAPAMTLTDREYQHMRDLAIAVLREVGVDTGGCNIQFAVNPADGSMIVIEMNPRVSRSSALASKATGFPIAKIAAKLAVGYTLDEISNDVTRETPASFEPALDYVVVKVPRFAFEKFPGADPVLTTHMKSVGEAMAIGRNFTEALGKALRSTETKATGFWTAPGDAAAPTEPVEELLAAAAVPTDDRLYRVERALRAGATVDQVATATGIDPWFVDQIALVVDLGAEVRDAPTLTAPVLRRAKRHGLSDRQVAALRPELAGEDGVRALRHRLGIRPVFKTVDTCAAEFAAVTPYHYSAYDEETEVVGAAGPREGAHPRQRAQPDRAGHRVRLLLRARGDGAAGRRLRDGHGQLQPGDRLHRLRHRRPALLRAAHLRGRARGRARRAAVRHRRRGDLHPGRADAAGTGAAAEGRRRPRARHPARGDRPRRAPGRLRAGAGRGRAARRRSTAPPPPSSRPRRSPTRSATRCWCAPRTCSAGAAWRSSTTSRTCSTTSTGPPRSPRTTRCSSTGSSTTPSRSTWTRCSTAPSSTSAA